jgi:outer membrane immunogenic protein
VSSIADPNSVAFQSGGIDAIFANTITALSTFSAGTKASGFIGGVQAGYNWQSSNWVYGIEADIQWLSHDGDFNSSNRITLINTQTVVSNALVTRSLDYLGTARGRIGMLWTPSLLGYATGGLAYGETKLNVAINQTLVLNSLDGPWAVAGAFSNTRFGWTAGAGIEWLFAPNWTAKIEYLYYDLGSENYSVGALISRDGGAAFTTNNIFASTDYDGHIVRAGINYKFGYSKAPVVAKY